MLNTNQHFSSTTNEKNSNLGQKTQKKLKQDTTRRKTANPSPPSSSKNLENINWTVDNPELDLGEEEEYVNPVTGERGGPRGPEPTRYGDW